MTVLVNALQKQLQNQENNVVLTSLVEDKSYTGQEVANLVATLEARLTEANIGKGDVVLIAMTNAASYPIIEQALWEVGAIAHPVAPTTGIDVINEEFDNYHYAAMFVDSNFEEVLKTEERYDYQPLLVGSWRLHFYRYSNYNRALSLNNTMIKAGNLAVILNTSGSTGKPKRVGLTHEQLFNSASHIGESQELTAADTTLVVMPMFHVNAQVISILATRLSGGKLVIADKFSASKFWDAVADHGVTWVSVVPTIIQILEMNARAKQLYEMRRQDIKMKYVRSASFSLPVERLNEFMFLYDIPIIEGYGMTETASLIALNPFDHSKAGSVGLPVATDIALFVDGTITTEAEQTGEIVLRGDHVITDYVDANPKSFYNGWLRTGDLGRFDSDGYLTIVGRIKEIISRGGEKVAPAAIEAVLRQLPFIKDVVVVGLPDELYGEEVTAAVVLNDNVTTAEYDLEKIIFAHAVGKLSRPERPTRVIFVSDYPRNPTGKVMRHKLIAQLGTD